MELILTASNWITTETSAAVCFSFSDEQPPADLAGGLARDLYEKKEFEGKTGETAILHRPQGFKADRLILVGLGEKAKAEPAELRKAAAIALRLLKAKGVRDALFSMHGALGNPQSLEAVVEGVLLGDFEPDLYKTDPKKNDKHVDAVRFCVEHESMPLIEALRRGRVIAEAQNFARTLANEPAQCAHTLETSRLGRTHGRRIRPLLRSARRGSHEAARHGSPARRRSGQR